YSDLFMVRRFGLFQAYDRKSKASHQIWQFCDSDLEVAFRRNACFFRNLEGVDLSKGDRSTNLYTINLHEMTSASPICLMARASSTKSWLWHQRLSHLNFNTINNLARNDLVACLPKFKYHKDHLCPSLERRNRTLVEAARTMLIFSRAPLFLWAEAIATAKPDISFLHVFGALCYPKNDREDIGKLGAKGDIGFFIGYSADSCAYRVYNCRTKKIMDTMNVSFDELLAMAFEQRSSKPKLNSMTSGHISSGLDLTYAPSTITTQQPSEGELDLCLKLCMMIPLVVNRQLLQELFCLLKNLKMEAIRIFLAYAEHKSFTVFQIDVKTTFLHGSLKEDVYVCQPEEIKDKLDLDQNGTPVDATKYRSMIGALMYLTSSRQDIVHATCLCARYQAKPTKKHLKEVKRIFRYLRGTVNTGLWYTKDSDFELTGFSDADYVGSLSTAEAEYVSLSACCAQVLWMRTQLTNYGFHFNKIPIYCDSKSSIAISCNPVQHSRTKHIAVRYHFIKEHMEKGTIELYFVKTDYQQADIFTKALLADRFNYLVCRLGMRGLSPKELERLTKSQ
nr:hypothetical protein [Tanacetum cinerariifolium]